MIHSVTGAGLSLPPSIASGPGAGPADNSFRSVINGLLEQTTQAQHSADQGLSDLALGQTDQLHQVMLSVAKADLAFRLTLEIRNKLMEAYQEIQRMQM